jgi:hypothetical protein
MNDQSVVVRHKEFVTEVKGSTAFSVQSVLPINPGLASTFPWLATIAGSFQEYRVRGMVYHYVPSSGSVASASPSLGTVMVQTSYRSSDSQPVSKAEMLNEYCASECVPSDSFCHPVECDPRENPFNVQYVRSTNVPANDNKLLYDLGVTYVATSGQQTNGAVLGDLWVTYEIELKKPMVYTNVTPFNSPAVFRMAWNNLGGSFNGLFPSATGGFLPTLNTLGLTVPSNTLVFPSEMPKVKLNIEYRIYANASLNLTTPLTTTYSNCYPDAAVLAPFNNRNINDSDDLWAVFTVDFTSPSYDPTSTSYIAFNLLATFSSTPNYLCVLVTRYA